MLSLLVAASVVVQSRVPSSVEGRVALLEARQMLESQQVWQLRAEFPPDVVKALENVDLHVQHDLEQEDRVRDLTRTVSQLEQRLAVLETMLQSGTPAEASATRIPVMQVQPLEVPARPAARKKAAAKKPHPRDAQ
jgi:hypothetical protein